YRPSPIVPCTTLFRSEVAARERAVDARGAGIEAPIAEQRVEALDGRVARVLVAAREIVLDHEIRRRRHVEHVARFEVHEVRAVRDRKSTRLNSSHVKK